MSSVKNAKNLSTEDATVSDLEVLLLAFDVLIEKRLKENPKSGVIVGKGTLNETKVKYTKIIKILERLDTYFRYKGTLSFGICGTCTNFSYNSSAGAFGTCQLSKKSKNEFDTCETHSIEGSGYGRSK